MDEFASKVFAELDFVAEGQKSEKFERLYGDIPGVRVPRVHWEATRRRVLTTAWVEGGVKLTAPKHELEAAGVDVKRAVNAAVACTLRQVFGEGFVHGDAHPGNLLATSEALYWIDFGIVCEVPERARSLLVGHVAHLVGRRYAKFFFSSSFFRDSGFFFSLRPLSFFFNLFPLSPSSFEPLPPIFTGTTS